MSAVVARARALARRALPAAGAVGEHGWTASEWRSWRLASASAARCASDYGVRTSDAEQVERGSSTAPAASRVAPARGGAGDLLLAGPAPAQLHVVVLTPGAAIFMPTPAARVVEVPGPVPWPVLSAWRSPGEDAVAAGGRTADGDAGPDRGRHRGRRADRRRDRIDHRPEDRPSAAVRAQGAARAAARRPRRADLVLRHARSRRCSGRCGSPGR